MATAISQAHDDGLPQPSRKRAYRSYALVTVLLLVFGLVRFPLETALTRENRQASLGGTQLDLGLRSKIGQLSFLAALSGFRTLVADLLWIEAHTAWEKVEYGKMYFLLNTVTTLAPHNVGFWDGAAWHMAYNASVAAMNDRKEKRIAVKLKKQHEYFMLGKDFLERGIANNPKSYTLYQNLGAIYRDKLNDHWDAYLAYEKAAACPNAPSFEKRFAAYELSKVPGHEREAYEKLKKLYDMGEQEHLPTLEKDLARMEEVLKIPEDQRVFKTPPASPLDAVKQKLGVPEEQRVYKTP